MAYESPFFRTGADSGDEPSRDARASWLTAVALALACLLALAMVQHVEDAVEHPAPGSLAAPRPVPVPVPVPDPASPAAGARP